MANYLIYLDLILNLTLLVALSIVSGFIDKRWRRETRSGVLMQGALFGSAAVVGMLRPLNLGPGLIFDGRSVMVSLCALYFGPWAAAVAGITAAACRIGLGGAGALTGVLVIVSSVGIGLLARIRVSPAARPRSVRQLYLFGLAVHLAMLALMFTLPDGSGPVVVRRIGLPVMLLYPLATILAGKILSDQAESDRVVASLRETEARYRLLFEQSPDGIVILDPDTARFLEFNDAACRQLGYSREEFARLTIADVETAETPREDRDRIAALLREGRIDFETRQRARHGEIKYIRVTAQIIEIGGRSVYHCVWRDITERKRSDAALRALSARQEAILDAVHDIIMEVNPDKVYTWANQAGLDFFGEDVIGKEAAFYFEGQQSTYQAVQPLFNGSEELLYVESWQRRKDGQKRLLGWWCRTLRDDRGEVTGALSSARDITEWHQAEVTLAESERNFRSLFSNMEEGVALHEIIHDASGKAVDYRILDTNPAFERHTGISAERSRGALASELYGPGGPPYLEEYSRVANGGKPITFETGFASLQKQFSISVVSPKPGRFAIVFEDITERKRQQEALRQKNTELERFIYTVSHDLKAPLVTIKTFLEYLESDRLKADAGRIEKDMFFMRSAADTMAKLLDELLEMSRIGRVVNPSLRVTFGDLVEDARNTVAGRLAERGVKVRVGDEPLTLFGDRRRLAEIWQNLIENAAKFMGDQAAPLIEIGLEPAGQKTIFFVRDNGIGIDPRHHGKIFGLFESLDPKIEGTGLGLALVKRIVELYGGTVAVESKGAGRGSTFRFTLPRAVMSGPGGETP